MVHTSLKIQKVIMYVIYRAWSSAFISSLADDQGHCVWIQRQHAAEQKLQITYRTYISMSLKKQGSPTLKPCHGLNSAKFISLGVLINWSNKLFEVAR